MKFINTVFLLLSLFFISLVSWADSAPCRASQTDCAPIGEWEISVALGAGVLTNPLNDGDNRPLLIIPSITYYGEKLFFERNTLGYTFSQTYDLAVSAIMQPNRENAFFSRWHVDNILVDSFSQQSTINFEYPQNNERVAVQLSDVKKRRWAIDAGLQLNWPTTRKVITRH